MRRHTWLAVLAGAAGVAGCGSVTDSAPDGGGAGEHDAGGLVIATRSLPDANRLRSYEVEVEVVAGAPPYRFGASGLPPGLAIDADSGVIANDEEAPAVTDATPTQVTITVTDDAGATHAVAYALPVIGLSSASAGEAFTCALDAGGAAFCWGDDRAGQLGNGEDEDESRDVPVAVQGDHVFASISAGGSHACALDESGAAWCWGENGAGQLGNADEQGVDSPVPVAVHGDHSFVAISAGAGHTCALDGDGAALCWGRNANGQLGNGDDQNQDRTVPDAVSGEHVFTAIAAGANHACGLDGDGAAHCWGGNVSGQLGNGDDEGDDSLVPVPVVGDHAFTRIDAGLTHTCALDGDAAGWCWGINLNGELGDGNPGQNVPEPVPVAGDHELAVIRAGNFHSCAVDADGAGLCWGIGFEGLLGDGSGEGSSVPIAVAGGHVVADLALGALHTCAIDDTATAWCWGASGSGRLGNGGADEDTGTPVPVVPGG